MNAGLLSEKLNKNCPQLIEDAISIIESNYAFLYGVDDLAVQLEVSKPHLIRRFTAVCNISPGKYLTYVRLEKAKAILRLENPPALELVAVACGYACANYFSKVFKKSTGLTPMAYAEAFRGQEAVEGMPRKRDSTADTADILQKMYL